MPDKEIELKCVGCGIPLTRDTAWLPDDTKDNQRYCYGCAPDDAIRVKDTI